MLGGWRTPRRRGHPRPPCPLTPVTPHEYARGKIWLLQPHDLDRLPVDTKVLTVLGKCLNVTFSYLDDMETDSAGYLPYGLPCRTWNYADTIQVLAPKDRILRRWTIAADSGQKQDEYCIAGVEHVHQE